ncbi:hypothetical protein Trydic_g3971 [Trypoxylus dichotomus]
MTSFNCRINYDTCDIDLNVLRTSQYFHCNSPDQNRFEFATIYASMSRHARLKQNNHPAEPIALSPSAEILRPPRRVTASASAVISQLNEPV